jgi:hypothetical protein
VKVGSASPFDWIAFFENEPEPFVNCRTPLRLKDQRIIDVSTGRSVLRADSICKAGDRVWLEGGTLVHEPSGRHIPSCDYRLRPSDVVTAIDSFTSSTSQVCLRVALQTPVSTDGTTAAHADLMHCTPLVSSAESLLRAVEQLVQKVERAGAAFLPSPMRGLASETCERLLDRMQDCKAEVAWLSKEHASARNLLDYGEHGADQTSLQHMRVSLQREGLSLEGKGAMIHTISFSDIAELILPYQDHPSNLGVRINSIFKHRKVEDAKPRWVPTTTSTTITTCCGCFPMKKQAQPETIRSATLTPKETFARTLFASCADENALLIQTSGTNGAKRRRTKLIIRYNDPQLPFSAWLCRLACLKALHDEGVSSTNAIPLGLTWEQAAAEAAGGRGGAQSSLGAGNRARFHLPGALAYFPELRPEVITPCAQDADDILVMLAPPGLERSTGVSPTVWEEASALGRLHELSNPFPPFASVRLQNPVASGFTFGAYPFTLRPRDVHWNALQAGNEVPPEAGSIPKDHTRAYLSSMGGRISVILPYAAARASRTHPLLRILCDCPSR